MHTPTFIVNSHTQKEITVIINKFKGTYLKGVCSCHLGFNIPYETKLNFSVPNDILLH